MSTVQTEPVASEIEARVGEVDREFAYENRCKVFKGKFWHETYPAHEALYQGLPDHRNARVIANVSGGQRLLDVGCGFGDMLYALRDRYTMLVGVDPSAAMVGHARDNFTRRGLATPYQVSQGLAEALPLGDEEVDTVVTTDTYEHIHPEFRARALAEIHRVLRPGGELVLVTPSRFWIRAYALLDNLLTVPRQIRAGKGVRVLALPAKNYTEVFCSKRELLSDLRRAGFRVERFERVGFYPAPERQGFLQPYMPWLAARPRLHGALLGLFRGIQALRVFNQKMLVRCVKPGAGALRAAEPGGPEARKAAA
jgi:ubiquinone/menaquinone biosynthesis C-methylase UbiE